MVRCSGQKWHGHGPVYWSKVAPSWPSVLVQSGMAMAQSVGSKWHGHGPVYWSKAVLSWPRVLVQNGTAMAPVYRFKMARSFSETFCEQCTIQSCAYV